MPHGHHLHHHSHLSQLWRENNIPNQLFCLIEYWPTAMSQKTIYDY